jgi:hypothetical protein
MNKSAVQLPDEVRTTAKRSREVMPRVVAGLLSWQVAGPER